MIPWSDIDTIMFDMDGTLLDLHFDNYFWQTLVREKNEAVRGRLEWYCLDYWTEELRLPIAELKQRITHKICIRPNVERLLDELQLSNKQLLMITNAHPGSLEIKMRHSGIADYFQQRISAHSLNLAKEHHGFWAALQEVVSYDPARTVLFDDNLAVLRQAQKEGIRHLYAIKQPDSQRPGLAAGEFPQIEDFEHIFPSRLGADGMERDE